MCLASGARVLEGLVSSLLHEVDSLRQLDSGIDTEVEESESENKESLEFFRLCSGCTSSIPTVTFQQPTILGIGRVIDDVS